MKLIIRQLGIKSYEEIWHKMQVFTDKRDEYTDDEIWLVQHPSVFTKGSASRPEHFLHTTNIPVVQSDRGGQITYHGEGQQIMYVLLDIKRLKEHGKDISVRELVTALEQSVVNTLVDYGIKGHLKAGAPGVYVDGCKICSLGLRIRKGCSFHGLALNVNMDLTPFNYINPCGYVGLKMCQLSELIHKKDLTCDEISPKLVTHFTAILGYSNEQIMNN